MRVATSTDIGNRFERNLLLIHKSDCHVAMPIILNNDRYQRLKLKSAASGIYVLYGTIEGLIGCLGSSLAELINQDVGRCC